MKKLKLLNDDAFKILDEMIEKNIKVDMALIDPPYNSTRLKWDKEPINWEIFFKKIFKITNIVISFSDYKNAHKLILNTNTFKYKIYWNKTKGTDFLNSKIKPLNSVEEILVFYKKKPIYNPQMTKGKPYKQKQGAIGEQYDFIHSKPTETINNGTRYPLNQINMANDKNKFHKTQKPGELMEYLVKTYSNENDTILDCFMGSGTTGVACKNLNRNFIGVELDKEYFEIAKERIKGE